MYYRLFRDTLDNAIVEIQQYFHFSNEKMYKLICEFTGGQHNAAAITLQANIHRDSRKHFKLHGLAVGAATTLPSMDADDIEHVSAITHRNRRFSFQVQSADGSGANASSSNNFVSPSQVHQKLKHAKDLDEGARSRRTSKVAKHANNGTNGRIMYATEESVSSAMEFLDVSQDSLACFRYFGCYLYLII